MGVGRRGTGGTGGTGGKRRRSRVVVVDGDDENGVVDIGSVDRGGGVDSEPGREETPGGTGGEGGSGDGDDVRTAVETGGDGLGTVYSLAGRRGTRVGGPGGPADVDSAAVQGEVLGQLGKFEETSFLASVKTARVTVGGDLEITLTVPISEKYQAMRVTDAPGVMLLFNAKRKKRGAQ